MNDVLYIKASETPLFAWNLRRLLLGCPVGLLTKKDIAFRRCLFGVPGGTRTHDIQNHNLTL